MKNLPTMIIVLFTLVLAGCANKEETKILPGTTDRVTLHDDTNRSLARQPNLPTILYNSPSLFDGCSFGNAFLSFLRVQDYVSCLKFTSAGTIRKYGATSVIQLYKNLKVNYTLHLLSIISCRDTTVMRYKANEFATSRFKEFKVVVENDTCRLVIDNIREFLK